MFSFSTKFSKIERKSSLPACISLQTMFCLRLLSAANTRVNHAWHPFCVMANTKCFGTVFQGLKNDAFKALLRRYCATSGEKTTHFGYETVTEEEKAERGTTVTLLSTS